MQTQIKLNFSVIDKSLILLENMTEPDIGTLSKRKIFKSKISKPSFV